MSVYTWLLILYLLTHILAIGFWVWIAAGFRKSRYRRIFGGVAFQLIAVVAFIGVIIQNTTVLFSGIFPFHLYLYHDLVVKMASFMGWALALPVCLSFVFLFILGLHHRTRVFAPGLAGLIFVIATFVAAEQKSQEEICKAARKFNVTKVPRNTFLWSARNARKEFQWGYHATIVVDGNLWAWSYGTNDWYPVPKDVNADEPQEILECVK